MGGRRSVAALSCAFLLALAPTFVLANTYGSNTYGEGTYNVGTDPAPAQSSSSGGGGNGPIVGSISGPIAVIVAPTVSAATSSIEIATSTATSTKASSPEIDALRQQIAYLQTVLAELLETRTDVAPSLSVPYRFGRDLQWHDTGEDVRQLQIFLNGNGYPLSQSGPGSPGEETNYFGAATFRALARFQAAHSLPTTGYFGVLTRALIASMTASTAR